MPLWSHWWTRVYLLQNYYTEWCWKWAIKKRKWTIKKRKWAIKKNNRTKNDTIKESIKKPMEIKSPKEDKNTTDYPNWFDRNKFKNFLAIIDSNKFNYKSRIGEFKYIDIKDLVNNIRNNTISEISAKKGLNTLNEIKNAEIIKYKRRTLKQKELLNLFNDLLDTILTDKTLMSSKDENENENDKTLMSSNDDDDNENENGKTLIIIKKLNNCLDEIIDKSKSFEDQIKSIRKVENLNEYCFINDYGDKELEFKIFKLKLAHLSNIIEKKLFKQIFGHTFETFANELINTPNKEENRITVNNINQNEEKIFEKDKKHPFYDYVIQPNDRRNNIIDAINPILDFNETIQLDLVWINKNQRIKKKASDFNW